MKNIFKFMGIALMASSLLVACNNDPEENPEDTTNTNQQQQEEPQQTASATVTFNGTVWEAGASLISDQYYSEYGITYERLYKVAQQLPYVDIMASANPGTYSYEAEYGFAEPDENFPEGYTYVEQNQNLDLYMVEYGEKQQVQLQQGSAGDWAMLSASLTVNSFDLNTFTATMTLNAHMYDYYSWYTGVAVNVEDAPTADLSVNVKNFTFTK